MCLLVWVGACNPVAVEAKKRFLEVPVVMCCRCCIVRGVLGSVGVSVVVDVDPVVVVTVDVVVVGVIVYLVCVFVRLLIVENAKEKISGVSVGVHQRRDVVYRVFGGMGGSVVVGQREVTEGAARGEGGGR